MVFEHRRGSLAAVCANITPKGNQRLTTGCVSALSTLINPYPIGWPGVRPTGGRKTAVANKPRTTLGSIQNIIVCLCPPGEDIPGEDTPGEEGRMAD